MKRILISAFCLLLLFSCSKNEKEKDIPSVPGKNDGPATPSAIRIMSYNVHYCVPVVPSGNTVPDVQATANAIKAGNPDVVLLQELDNKTNRSGKVDQLTLLSQYTGLKYYYYSKAIDYDGGGFGVGLLSKYPLENSKTIMLPKVAVPGSYVEQRVLCVAQVSFPGGYRLTIATSHLDLTEENRRLQVPAINDALSESAYPVVFGGDFNSAPGSETINALDAAQFQRTCVQDCNSIPSIQPNRQIDYITCRPANKFTVVSHQVFTGVTASDHLPVLTVFEMK